MSERIQELIKQSKMSLWEPPDPASLVSQVTHPGNYAIFSDEFLAKFAELIVAECVNVLDPDGEYTAKYKHSHTPGFDGLRTVLSHEHFYEMMAANKLKKHFGVEE